MSGAAQSDGGQRGELSASDRRVAEAASGVRRQRGARTRGWAEDGPRSKQVLVRLSEEEWLAVAEVSERVGMRPAAWMGEVAVRYARGQVAPVPADMRDVVTEVIAQRPYLTSIGSLLNQIARVVHATGAVPEDASERLEVVRRQFAELLRRHDAEEADATSRAKANRHD